ncbi:type II toxin-antitoxin system VapC family toxin [Methylovulum psychrotolerans]|nr:PIN domain-containing protein [Methylovulum psychrotolerans]
MTRQALFMDTSGWANYLIKTEPFHVQTSQLLQQCFMNKAGLVTSNYVLAELIALLYSPLRITKPQQIKIMETIKAAFWVKVIHIDQVKEQQAYQLWKSRPDKKWSLVDCSSFVLMQDERITAAITSDHHFEQAGFIRLLKM